jgi:hypothetical protein
MMKVTLEKLGGFAAMRRAPTVLDSAALATSHQQELQQLVTDVREEPLVPPAAGEQLRDAMSYKISVEQNGTTTVYRQRDLEMSAAFQRLMRWIEEHAQ